MLIYNPQLTNEFISITYNGELITFLKTLSYLAYKSKTHNIHTWIGKNCHNELLVIVFSKLIYVHYLAKNGHFCGEGLLGGFITLKQPSHKKRLTYSSPKHVGYFIKPTQADSTLVKATTSMQTLNSLTQEDRAMVPPAMLADYTTIRVLFCYSSNYLSTYITPSKLTDDNTILCAIASAIFTNNNPPNNVIIMGVDNIEIDNLENGATCLADEDEIDNLFERYMNNELPLAINKAILLQTNLTVFQCKYCTDPDDLPFGTSYIIGFENPEEACVCLIRPPVITDTLLSDDEPTVLAHEIGHILGCSHNLEVGEVPNPSLTPGYGHAVFNSDNSIRCGTIMSYAQYPIWYFSNPNIFQYPSPDQNTPCGEVGISEAHSVVDANLPRLANSTITQL